MPFTSNSFGTVYTDEWKAYNRPHEIYNHKVVNHGRLYVCKSISQQKFIILLLEKTYIKKS